MSEAFARQIFNLFNLCEGILWIGIAFAFAVAYRLRRRNGDLALAAGLLFFAFGLSDFVEIQTGGWYKPWWLLLWKASNLAGFVAVYLIHRRRSLPRQHSLDRATAKK